MSSSWICQWCSCMYVRILCIWLLRILIPRTWILEPRSCLNQRIWAMRWFGGQKKRTKVKDTDSSAHFNLISVSRKIIDQNMKRQFINVYGLMTFSKMEKSSQKSKETNEVEFWKIWTETRRSSAHLGAQASSALEPSRNSALKRPKIWKFCVIGRLSAQTCAPAPTPAPQHIISLC